MKLGPCLTAPLLLAFQSVATPAQKPPTQPRPITVDDLFQIRSIDEYTCCAVPSAIIRNRYFTAS